jgi:RNA polymerase sigma-70 factor (ECF subfamily)
MLHDSAGLLGVELAVGVAVQGILLETRHIRMIAGRRGIVIWLAEFADVGEDYHLATLFLSIAPDAGADGALLDEKLRQLLVNAQIAWPSVVAPLEAYVVRLAQCMPPGCGALSLSSHIHTNDIYLACACANNDGPALAIFDDLLQKAVTVAIARVDSSPQFAAEVRQALRERLLVGPNPRIQGYAGVGPLAGWVRTAALRLALNIRQQRTTQAMHETMFAREFAPADDPELRSIRDQHRQQLKDAVTNAIAQLTPEDRHLLRLYYIDGLTLAKLGVLYKRGRTTMLRHLETVRARVLKQTKSELRALLSLSPESCDSLLNLVAPDLEVSFRRLLEGTESKAD